ncbi:transmembrane and immunoglobulin domain-containing 1, partial [Paramuricea clavata]
GKTTSSPVHVFVAVKPTETINCRGFVTVDEGCKDFTVDEGKDFTCVCRGENGNPPASVTWYKDGVQIGTTEKEQTLTRSNVTGTDSGTYKCVAQSHTLTEEKSVVIVVKIYSKSAIIQCFCMVLFIFKEN